MVALTVRGTKEELRWMLSFSFAFSQVFALMNMLFVLINAWVSEHQTGKLAFRLYCFQHGDV